jgi:glycosyltransferase involved in cell wall biosynthesis
MPGDSPVPLVSVVIPVWDSYVDRDLRDAVDSVHEQRFPCEVIIVDNASAVPVHVADPVKVVHLDRRCSTGAARNAALPRLRTPYVVFLDADDLLLPGSLQELTRGIDSGEKTSVYTLGILDDTTGELHRAPRRIARALARFPLLFALANSVWSLLPIQGCAVMRVSDVRDCRGYADSDHGEDWVLATSLAFRGRVSFGRLPGLRYRLRSTSPGAERVRTAVLLENARRVRRRLSEDPAVPAWLTGALPIIAVAQWITSCVVYPCYRAARGLVGQS